MNSERASEPSAARTPGSQKAADLEQVAVVEREVRRLVRRFRSYSTELARWVHPDLEPAVYALLIDIADSGGARASGLADERGVSKAVISRQVRELDRLGLIERRPDPSDARAQVLIVSAEGGRAVKRAIELRRQAVERLLGSSSGSESTAIVDALTRFNDVMEQPD